MAQTRITINGRTYESAEAMPPEVRRAYEQVMREASPALKDENKNGIPDILEEDLDARATGGVVVENRIVVNGERYDSVNDMPPAMHALYEDAMSRVRRGGGVTVTRHGPTFSLGFSRSSGSTTTAGAPGPTPIEPSSVESSLRTVLVLVAVAVIGALVVWAWLGR